MPELAAISTPLPWQQDNWQRLLQRLQQDQLPHALLLTGLPGTGKQQFALALARLLLCHQPTDGLNCGNCHACELSRAGTHGDLLWLEPEGKSRVIRVDQVRNLVDFANQTANFGRRKVVLINPAERMNLNAANALLKSLEEPAGNTCLLLVSHRPHQMPATVRSRCQLQRLPAPGYDQALDYVGRLTGNREQSETLLALADGQPMRAAQLYLEEGGAESVAAIREVLGQLAAARIKPVQAAAALGEIELDEFLEQTTGFLQAYLRELAADEPGRQRSRAAFRILDEARHWQRALAAGANPNRQLMLDHLLTRFAQQLGA